MPGTSRKNSLDHNHPIGEHGILYVVATPIGNLEDITLRALRILKEVDLIAAEDTRHTRKLLNHFGISTPTVSYYKEKERQRAALVLNKLREGNNVALVSDAGTPGISDPGSILVHEAIAADIQVEPIPGPSALTAALSVAGIADINFVFLGFAPSRKKQRQDLLLSLRREQRYLVFFEAPHRLHAFLQDCFDILGGRRIFWGREMTKLHEEKVWSDLGAVLELIKGRKVKGESVFVIAGAETAPPISDGTLKELLAAARKSGSKSLKDTVGEITTEYNLPRSRVYKAALKIWQQQPAAKAPKKAD